MAKIRLKFNNREVKAILRNTAVLDELEFRAELIHDAIDHEGYEIAVGVGKSRARASVIAVTQWARRSNAIHNTLVSNMDAGRG